LAFFGLFRRQVPTGKQHFQRGFATDGPGNRHHGRGAEKTDFDSGCGKPGALFGHGQVAPGHQLTSCGGGNSLDLSDHRLRNLMDHLHHSGALVENEFVFFDTLIGHFRQIMSGTKIFARSTDDNYLYRFIL
jgi:hypothetical protein